jgi:hypothetical protein
MVLADAVRRCISPLMRRDRFACMYLGVRDKQWTFHHGGASLITVLFCLMWCLVLLIL